MRIRESNSIFPHNECGGLPFALSAISKGKMERKTSSPYFKNSNIEILTNNWTFALRKITSNLLGHREDRPETSTEVRRGATSSFSTLNLVGEILNSKSIDYDQFSFVFQQICLFTFIDVSAFELLILPPLVIHRFLYFTALRTCGIGAAIGIIANYSVYVFSKTIYLCFYCVLPSLRTTLISVTFPRHAVEIRVLPFSKINHFISE